MRQWRHQAAVGDVDAQHGQRANTNAQPVFHRLAGDVEVIEYLPLTPGQVLQPGSLQPACPIASAGLGGEQGMPFDVGGS